MSVIGDITGRQRDCEDRVSLLAREQEARRRLTFLAEVSNVLASSLDYHTTLASVAHLAAPAHGRLVCRRCDRVRQVGEAGGHGAHRTRKSRAGPRTPASPSVRSDRSRRCHPRLRRGTREPGKSIEVYALESRVLTVDGKTMPPEQLPMARALHDGGTVVDARWRVARQHGCHGGECGAGAGGGRNTSRRKPALIILDMVLPLLDGVEGADQVRERYGGTAPILLMTADTRAAAKAERVGGFEYLQKPFDIDVLLGAVRRGLSA